MTNTIEIHGLTRRFGNNEAVHDLSLSVQEGSVTAFLGPNGAGKTTTIRLMMNLLHATAGSARVLGVDSRRLGASEFARIGHVSENQEQPLWMTVGQLLDYCRQFYPTWDRALEAQLLKQFALPQDRKLAHLSRGMRMKAALLSSLAYRPKLLVLDEPFSGLDPLVRDEFIHGLLETVTAGETTVFISSHDIAEVERLCDRVTIIDSGRLQLEEATETLQTRFRRIEVDLRGGPAQIISPPANWLNLERAGDRVSFIETRYERAGAERSYREHFPDADVKAHPMTLREIFVALARQTQSNQGRNAA